MSTPGKNEKKEQTTTTVRRDTNVFRYAKRYLY